LAIAILLVNQSHNVDCQWVAFIVSGLLTFMGHGNVKKVKNSDAAPIQITQKSNRLFLGHLHPTQQVS